MQRSTDYQICNNCGEQLSPERGKECYDGNMPYFCVPCWEIKKPIFTSAMMMINDIRKKGHSPI